MLINLSNGFDTHIVAHTNRLIPRSYCLLHTNTMWILKSNILYDVVLFGISYICAFFFIFILFFSQLEAADTATLLFAFSLYIFHQIFLLAMPDWCRHKLISPACLRGWALCTVSPSRWLWECKESVLEEPVSVQFMNSVWFQGTLSVCV